MVNERLKELKEVFVCFVSFCHVSSWLDIGIWSYFMKLINTSKEGKCWHFFSRDLSFRNRWMIVHKQNIRSYPIIESLKVMKCVYVNQLLKVGPFKWKPLSSKFRQWYSLCNTALNFWVCGCNPLSPKVWSEVDWKSDWAVFSIGVYFFIRGTWWFSLFSLKVSPLRVTIQEILEFLSAGLFSFILAIYIYRRNLRFWTWR